MRRREHWERDPHWHWWWVWWHPRWAPGSVPPVNRAWRPDLSAHTNEHFRRRLRRWAHSRGVAPSAVVLDMNTGNVPIRRTTP